MRNKLNIFRLHSIGISNSFACVSRLFLSSSLIIESLSLTVNSTCSESDVCGLSVDNALYVML